MAWFEFTSTKHECTLHIKCIHVDNPWITFTYINKFELSMVDPPILSSPPTVVVMYMRTTRDPAYRRNRIQSLRKPSQVCIVPPVHSAASHIPRAYISFALPASASARPIDRHAHARWSSCQSIFEIASRTAQRQRDVLGERLRHAHSRLRHTTVAAQTPDT